MLNFLSGAAILAEGFDVSSVMQTAVNAVSGEIYDVLGIVVPVAAGITGAVVAVKFGLKWLRSLK